MMSDEWLYSPTTFIKKNALKNACEEFYTSSCHFILEKKRMPEIKDGHTAATAAHKMDFMRRERM